MIKEKQLHVRLLTFVRSLVEKVKRNRPLNPIQVPITKKALVIGGGIAGIQASLDIANCGYQVILIEKEIGRAHV